MLQHRSSLWAVDRRTFHTSRPRLSIKNTVRELGKWPIAIIFLLGVGTSAFAHNYYDKHKDFSIISSIKAYLRTPETPEAEQYWKVKRNPSSDEKQEQDKQKDQEDQRDHS